MFLINDNADCMKGNDDHAARANMLTILKAHGVPFDIVEYEDNYLHFFLFGFRKEREKRAKENHPCTRSLAVIQITEDRFSVLYVPDQLSDDYIKTVERVAHCGCDGCRDLIKREKPSFE